MDSSDRGAVSDPMTSWQGRTKSASAGWDFTGGLDSQTPAVVNSRVVASNALNRAHIEGCRLASRIDHHSLVVLVSTVGSITSGREDRRP